jgi:hypothetical protein
MQRRFATPYGDAPLLLSHSISMDCCGGAVSVAQPLLRHVERDALTNGLDAEAVP